MSNMQEATKAVRYFKDLQKEIAGYKETGNITTNKFTMKDIIEDIEDNVFLKKLFRFFLTYSDDKSMKAFFKEYDDYAFRLQSYIADAKLRRALQEKTVKGK